MKIGDRVCYRAGTAPAETGTVTAVVEASGDERTVEILLDSGARIKIVASRDWTIVSARPDA